MLPVSLRDLVGAIGFYVMFLLPKMMHMLGKDAKDSAADCFHFNASTWLKDNFVFLGVCLLLCIGSMSNLITAGRLTCINF